MYFLSSLILVMLSEDLISKSLLKYRCLSCDYYTCNITDWNKHLNTSKHISKSQKNEFSEVSEDKSTIYSCDACNYKTTKKTDWNKHISRVKHSNNINQHIKNEKLISCKICNKIYSSYNGLWVHKKKCKKIDINDESNKCINNNDNNNDNDNNDDNININTNNDVVNEFSNNLNELLSIENFMELMKQNSEFKELLAEQNKQLLEQNKMIIDLAKNSGNNNNNTINSHNKTFNLQVFLNEKCKDAMNIDEFVDSLKLNFNDLENVGELGFVKGISRIFINGLRELDVYKRPIHCSDLKREVIHLKEDGVWLKDNENKDSMKKVVKMIANKNINKIYEWKAAYPSHRYSDDPKNDIYLKFLCQSMGAKTREEDIVYYEKVISNVAKEVTIDKKNY